MLSISGLSAYYGESLIIPKLDLEVPDKEIVCLIGRNGVGKTTTLKSIMGLVKNPEGKIILDGIDISHKVTFDRARNGIGYVPQGRDIFPRLTVQENLELGLRARGIKGDIPDYIYDLFPILPKFAKRKGGDLSGGQQQQLAIARALVTEPKILILDEPTEGIQPSVIQDIGEAIKKINQWRGLTVLIVEQYLDFVLGISDSLYVMERGEIQLHDKTRNVKASDIQKIMTG
ncbi:MAG: urea ABC transporter ATP-binding subunit UrtE [Treponema sp.]|nr:urea ABC transporter ATP-binding subunit UrtE [Treponema sp.]